MIGAILAIRPEPGLTATIAAARELGLQIHGLELSRIEPVDWSLPDITEVDALLVGSANAFRHAGAKLDLLTHLPVYAVGAVTAEAARERGFSVAQVGTGGLQALLDDVSEPKHYLRLAGEERVSLVIPTSSAMTEQVVYRITELPLGETALNALRNNAIVLLYSAGSATHFANECDRLGIDRSSITLAVLGPRIAQAAGEPWNAIHVASQPNDAHLLAMVRDICK